MHRAQLQCQCSMIARVVAACALALSLVRAQDAVYVEVSPHYSEIEEIEHKRITELAREIADAKQEILQLYTDYTAKVGEDLKGFLKNISLYADDVIGSGGPLPDNDLAGCREKLDKGIKKIKLDAYRAASFNGEHHHKFLLGYMVVFRMHINKSEEYIRKCDRALLGCGFPCDLSIYKKPKVKRWKRLAAAEIHRVKDDIQHTRKSYEDLALHSKKRLIHLKKQVETRSIQEFQNYHKCLVASDRD